MKKGFLLVVLILVLESAWTQIPTLYIPVGHNEAITDAAFTKDGAYLFSASQDKTLKIWETTTGREIKTIPNVLNADDKFPDNVKSFCSSPSGKLVASFSYFVNMLISTDDLAVKKVFKIEGSSAGDFSPDESYLVVATGGTLVQVNLKDYSQKLVYTQDEPGYFTKVKISQDGKWLLVISYQNRNATVFNTSSWQKVAEFSGNKSIFGFSPAGDIIQVDQLETEESLLTAFNLPARTIMWQKTVPSVYSSTNNSLDFSKQSAKGVLGNGQGNILFDYQTGEFIHIIFSEQKPSFAGLKLYPSGNSTLVCYNNRGEIRMELISLPDNYVIRSFINRAFNPYNINISPVSSDFIAGSNGSTIGIANDEGHISAVGLEKKSSGSFSRFSGDGKLLYILEKGISNVITVFDWKSRMKFVKYPIKEISTLLPFPMTAAGSHFMRKIV